MTLTARVVLRQGPSSREPLFLSQARAQAARLKSEGDQTSEVRMDRFREIGRQRRVRDAENLARQQARDRRLLVASAGALGILLMAILISLLVELLR